MYSSKTSRAEENWEEEAVVNCVDPRHKFHTSTHAGAGAFALLLQLPGQLFPVGGERWHSEA